MTNQVTNEFASCTISPVNNANLSESTKSKLRNLSQVYVEPQHRKQGYATRLMQQVIQEAQEAGLSLLIEVDPYGDFDMDLKQLATFYAKLGFIKIQQTPRLMVHYCKPEKKITLVNKHGEALN